MENRKMTDNKDSEFKKALQYQIDKKNFEFNGVIP